MLPSMPTLIFAGIVALFVVLVDGGAALIIMSTSPGDAFRQRVLQDIGAAMIAASPFVFVIQLCGWAGMHERDSKHPRPARR
jgi:hypothetical protein